MNFLPEVDSVLNKISEKWGFAITSKGLICKATGRKVQKKEDIEKVEALLEMVDTKISDIAAACSREEASSIDACYVPQRAYPVLDERLSYPPVNGHDIEIFERIRVPYAYDEESFTLKREDGILVWLEGTTATRAAAESLRVALPEDIVKSIDAKFSAYSEKAQKALKEISAECTRTGQSLYINQIFTDWMLKNLPSAMIPTSKNALQLRCTVHGKGMLQPEAVLGLVHPLDALERNSALAENSAFRVVNLKSLSNDPGELAITHIDLTSLPSGETTAWDQMAQKYTAEEWEVLQAYIYAAFDMKNTSRQALVIYDSGHTGKTTLFNIVQWALGGSRNCAFPNELSSPKDDRFFTSTYYGKHAIFIPDSKNPNLLRTGWLHSYTGGDQTSVQYKNKNAFSAKCYGKAFIGTNTLPSLDTKSEHIKTRLIILRPRLTAEALEQLAQRDASGEIRRGTDGKILLKKDPVFEQKLKDEFWCFLSSCKAAYDELCPDRCTIQLPLSVLESHEIAEDPTTSIVIELLDEICDFGEGEKCHARALREAISELLEQRSSVLGGTKITFEMILKILAENFGVTYKNSIRIDGAVSSGYVGIGLKVQKIDSFLSDASPDSDFHPILGAEALDLKPIDLSKPCDFGL